MVIEKATDTQIQEFINRYDSWSIVDCKLHREYVFSNFVEAFGFMTESALIAESSDHHPEWFNAYKKVIVDLTTHEAGFITERDLDLAESMEKIAIKKGMSSKVDDSQQDT